MANYSEFAHGWFGGWWTGGSTGTGTHSSTGNNTNRFISTAEALVFPLGFRHPEISKNWMCMKLVDGVSELWSTTLMISIAVRILGQQPWFTESSKMSTAKGWRNIVLISWAKGEDSFACTSNFRENVAIVVSISWDMKQQPDSTTWPHHTFVVDFLFKSTWRSNFYMCHYILVLSEQKVWIISSNE